MNETGLNKVKIDEEEPAKEAGTERDETAEDADAVIEPDLNEKITSLESDLSASNEKYLRLYAEFENYKKRVQKDREELLKYGAESLMDELLVVLDNLEMAVEHSSSDTSANSLLEGVELTLKELRKVLKKHGVEEIKAMKMKFDPQLHHAMSHIDRSDVDDKTVVEEYRKGYMYKERVLRPSFVAVSNKVEEEKEAANNE